MQLEGKKLLCRDEREKQSSSSSDRAKRREAAKKKNATREHTPTKKRSALFSLLFSLPSSSRRCRRSRSCRREVCRSSLVSTFQELRFLSFETQERAEGDEKEKASFWFCPLVSPSHSNPINSLFLSLYIYIYLFHPNSLQPRTPSIRQRYTRSLGRAAPKELEQLQQRR